MGAFRVDGAELAYALDGDDGAAVVHLHGLGSSRSRDRQLGWDLGAELTGVRMLRYDARGHGASTGRADPEDYAWPHLAQDLLDLLDHLFPGEPVHGVGVSMGAATLLHAALANPARFASLALALPPTAWQSRPPRAQTYLHAAEIIEQHGVEFLLRAQQQVPVPPAAPYTSEPAPDVDAALLPTAYRGAAASDLPARADLTALTIPVTLFAWVDDPGHPVDTAHTLSDLLGCPAPHLARTPTDLARWPVLLQEAIPHG
ncbi:MAG: alpha/beta fold hydrolase [Micrococcaceae bacterium]